MAAPEELRKFADAPALGLSLYVQSRWCQEMPDALPSDRDAVVCEMLACDGERCWEGRLLRSHLAGPLGQSWSKTSNLHLLYSALSVADPTSGELSLSQGCMPADLSRQSSKLSSEAIWTCEDGGEYAQLQLSVRFIFREGPVLVIRGISLPRADSIDGLSRLFGLALLAQDAAMACRAEADRECAELVQEQDSLRTRLEEFPHQWEAEEQRLLAEFTGVLNAQKRRCRKLWERNNGSTRDLPKGPEVPPMPPSIPASLEHCLDRKAEVEQPQEPVFQGRDATLSLNGIPPSAAVEPPSFSIPLTLGMSNCSVFVASSNEPMAVPRTQQTPPSQSIGRRPLDAAKSFGVGKKRPFAGALGGDLSPKLLRPKTEPPL